MATQRADGIWLIASERSRSGPGRRHRQAVRGAPRISRKPFLTQFFLSLHLLSMTRWKKNNAVGVEPLILQGVHTGYGLALIHVNHSNGAVTHPWQIEETVLHEQVPLIGGED